MSDDLPIALGILIASGQLDIDISDSIFTGELSLDGRVRSITGALPQAILAKNQSLNNLFLPQDNAKEAAIVQEITIYPLKNLLSLFLHLSKQQLIKPLEPINFSDEVGIQFDYDMKDIKGQQQTKRALEIAAAGGHNILML